MLFASVCRPFYSSAVRRVLVLLVLLLSAYSPAPAAVYDSGIVLPRTNDMRVMREFLEHVQQERLNNGIVNFTPYSALLIRESQDALLRSDFRAADMYAEFACTLSPDTAAVYAARVRQLWKDKKGSFSGLARNLSLYLMHSLSPYNIEDFSQAVFENSAALAGAILLSLCCITLLALLSCLPRFHHDLRHMLPEAMPDFSVKIVLLIVFAVPLVFGLSLVWLCAWALALLFAYLSRTARQVVTVLFVLLVLVLPFLAATMGFAKFMPHDEVLKLLWKANYGYCDARDTELLENALDAQDVREEVLFSLGLVYKRRGSLDMAQKYYEKVLKADPTNYRASVNLGNVFFAQNNRDRAIGQYEKAAVMNSHDPAAAYFNLSRVYQQKFMFSESENALNIAKRYDAKRVSLYLKHFTDNYNRRVIDETIPASRLWDKGYQRFSAGSPLVQDIWRRMAGGIAYSYGPFAFLALLIGILFLSDRERVRIAIRCKYCGKAICQRCQHATVSTTTCTHCTTLLQKQSKLGYAVREEKMAGIRQYLSRKRMIGLVFGYAVPGAGHFWTGHCIPGALGILIFFLLFMKTLIPLLFEGPWGFLFGPRILEFSFYGVLLLAYWFAMVSYFRSMPARTMEESLILKTISQ